MTYETVAIRSNYSVPEAGERYGMQCSPTRTTHRVRAERQASKEASGALAKRYGLERNTVAKWRAQTTTANARMAARARQHRSHCG
jgi:hypothetical protein